MSVYLPKDGRTWRYRFRWRGQWYRGSTGQLRKGDAELFDKKEQLRVRQEAGGIAAYDASRSPHIQRWAEIYYREVKSNPRIKRPERIKDLLRVVLRFWGARPASPTKEDIGPFRDLRLVDPIADPQLIQRFEEWMTSKGWRGQTKNQYRSVMSQMYVLADSHLWRKTTQVTFNPFRGLRRDPKVTRDVSSSLDDMRAVLEAAAYHVRLAVAIGLLAHKLRRDNILGLRWKDHIVDFGPRKTPAGQTVYGWIRVHEHKSDGDGAPPLVIPIVEQLHTILADARARHPGNSHVVTYRDKPVKDIRGGLRLACRRAGVNYGRFSTDGLTFHTLRHMSSTTMAELDISEAKRKNAAGHKSISTTQGYTHLRPIHELEPLEQLSGALPIADLVTATTMRAPDLKPDPLGSEHTSKHSGIRAEPAAP